MQSLILTMASHSCVRKSPQTFRLLLKVGRGRGTWDLGLGTWGLGDVGMWGRGDEGTQGGGTQGRRNSETRGIRGRDKQITPDFCAELDNGFPEVNIHVTIEIPVRLRVPTSSRPTSPSPRVPTCPRTLCWLDAAEAY